MQQDKTSTLREAFNLTVVVLEIGVLVVSFFVPGILALTAGGTSDGEGATNEVISFAVACF